MTGANYSNSGGSERTSGATGTTIAAHAGERTRFEVIGRAARPRRIEQVTLDARPPPPPPTPAPAPGPPPPPGTGASSGLRGCSSESYANTRPRPRAMGTCSRRRWTPHGRCRCHPMHTACCANRPPFCSAQSSSGNSTRCRVSGGRCRVGGVRPRPSPDRHVGLLWSAGRPSTSNRCRTCRTTWLPTRCASQIGDGVGALITIVGETRRRSSSSCVT